MDEIGIWQTEAIALKLYDCFPLKIYFPHKFEISIVTFHRSPKSSECKQVNKINFWVDLKANPIPSCNCSQRKKENGKVGGRRDEMCYRQQWCCANSKKVPRQQRIRVSHRLVFGILLNSLHLVRYNAKVETSCLNGTKFWTRKGFRLPITHSIRIMSRCT